MAKAYIVDAAPQDNGSTLIFVRVEFGKPDDGLDLSGRFEEARRLAGDACGNLMGNSFVWGGSTVSRDISGSFSVEVLSLAKRPKFTANVNWYSSNLAVHGEGQSTAQVYVTSDSNLEYVDARTEKDIEFCAAEAARQAIGVGTIVIHCQINRVGRRDFRVDLKLQQFKAPYIDVGRAAHASPPSPQKNPWMEYAKSIPRSHREEVAALLENPSDRDALIEALDNAKPPRRPKEEYTLQPRRGRFSAGTLFAYLAIAWGCVGAVISAKRGDYLSESVFAVSSVVWLACLILDFGWWRILGRVPWASLGIFAWMTFLLLAALYALYGYGAVDRGPGFYLSAAIAFLFGIVLAIIYHSKKPK